MQQHNSLADGYCGLGGAGLGEVQTQRVVDGALGLGAASKPLRKVLRSMFRSRAASAGRQRALE